MTPIRPLLVSLAFAASLPTGSGCARSQPHTDEAPNDATPTTAGKTGTIEGRILHPAHVVPALRICAIGSGAPQDAKRVCIDTRPSQNTYRIDGLPPTPIANPGEEAIKAVLNPPQTNELFFVADGTGGHVFAETLDEHNQNVRRWRKLEAEKAAQTAKETQGATAQ